MAYNEKDNIIETLILVLVIVVIILAAALTGNAKIRSDLNHDNIVDYKDVAIMAAEWLKRDPDYILKIDKYGGRDYETLSMIEKQMLFMAEHTRAIKEKE